MPKGVEANALNNSANATGQANGAYNTVNSIYTQEALHPQGLTPQQIADQTTSSDQTLGGSNASAAGQGALTAARTNNAGGYQAAIAEAARQAGATRSQNNLGIQDQSAMLARQQQQQGLAGLNGIYNTGNSTGLGYLNTAENASAANDQMIDAGIGAVGQIGGGWAGGGFKTPCWVAAELYGGWEDPRTHLVRNWIFGDFSKSYFGRMMAKLYLRFGERLAARIKTDWVSRWIMQKVFGWMLRQAQKGHK